VSGFKQFLEKGAKRKRTCSEAKVSSLRTENSDLRTGI
jgi:hypothetical protein